MTSPEDWRERLRVPSEDGPLASFQRTEKLRGLEGLKPDEKGIVLFVHFHGRIREAIASRFKEPVATVMTWPHRSLAPLHDCLGQ